MLRPKHSRRSSLVQNDSSFWKDGCVVVVNGRSNRSYGGIRAWFFGWAILLGITGGGWGLSSASAGDSDANHSGYSIATAIGRIETVPTALATLEWWRDSVNEYLLDEPNFLQVDVASLLTSTLEFSPRISAISRRTSIAYEEIVQQQAVFDPAILMDSGLGHTNDPVGSKLTTGGPPRSIQDSFTGSAGVRKLTQLGTAIDVSQDIGTLQSNSLFFDPLRQGNSRLNLSITQPLMATSGRVYNTRLITQASIDSHIAWQQLRLDLESHLVDTLTTFWRLYERRSQLVQQRELIQRGRWIGRLVTARADFDSGPLQQIKVTRRLAGDRDRLLEIEADVRRLQVRLKSLVGSPLLTSSDDSIEFIPLADPNFRSNNTKSAIA